MEQFASEFSDVRLLSLRATTSVGESPNEFHKFTPVLQRICTSPTTSRENCDLHRLLQTLIILLLLNLASGSYIDNENGQTSSNQDFTFAHNGSYIQIDAGREWPFNSKREISFRFKTKSPHGLLIYQTFDHNKLQREDEQDNIESNVKSSPTQGGTPMSDGASDATVRVPSRKRRSDTVAALEEELKSDASLTSGGHTNTNNDRRVVTLSQLTSNTITATASEKLVNSLFSASPIAAINGNQRNGIPSLNNVQLILSDSHKLTTSIQSNQISRDGGSTNSQGRENIALINSEPINIRTNYGARSSSDDSVSGESTILSSSAISSFSASFYELYLKLENGRMKLMYEFGSRLNQTYCGKGLNDDRWHRVDLKVDPEINQMVLILDQQITVEIALSMATQQEDDVGRRSELVFTNSILYLGGLNNNASIVKNVRQRLYMAQYIGCIGQVMLKTDQHTDQTGSQPATIDRMNLVKRGCINSCETNNYCLHKSTCVNYYTHTRCDCFGTVYEDVYCWQDKLTSLSMFGHSILVYRIYDWRDRYHSNVNRFSMQFKTVVADSILFFAYGDMSSQPVPRTQVNPTSHTTMSMMYNGPNLNITNLQTIQRPNSFQYQPNNNYLAISLANGSLVVEVNFGDQPILLSNLLYEKVNLQSKLKNTSATNLSLHSSTLSDGHWHNITFTHQHRQISLHIDEFSVSYTLPGKNYHLYFDPSIYIGSVPNFLLNETRALLRPFNLRYKYVGCMRSIYFNQQNILLALKQNSSMVEYRDILGQPKLDTCVAPEPSSLPLTLRSGKSYLTFQFLQNQQQSHKIGPVKQQGSASLISSDSQTKIQQNPSSSSNELQQPNSSLKKTTRIHFEYRTSLKTYFLAGGHLRDVSYHDLGGFWTLYARDDCQLYFTMSSGLTFEPERVLRLDVANKSCEPDIWYKISISLISGDKILNITRSRVLNGNSENGYDDRLQSNFENISDQGSYSLESSVELLHQIQIGGDLTKFGDSSSIPFTGCVRRIIINGHSFDSRDFVTSPSLLTATGPITVHQNLSILAHPPLPAIAQYDLISHRIAQGYVTLDSCRLVNPCSSLNPCKNNGVCKINELGEPDCDCSKTGYIGKRCQFSIYKQSCQELFLSGQRKSSFYLIDIDRNGPLRPIRVRCNMEDGGGNIETSISHNLPAEYYVRRSIANDVVLDITYLLFHHMYTHDGFYVHDDTDESARSSQESVLKSLIHQSEVCKQYVRYECRSAPLNLGNKTWMEVHYPKRHKLTSLSGNNDQKCLCAASAKKCLNPTKGCNCDSNELSWSDDSIELTKHEQVGITRFVLLRQDETRDEDSDRSFQVESQSRFTLSDLKCYGTRYFGSEHEITFKTNDAYIEVPGWRRGDISFHFRTASNPPAIILYQLATSRNHGYFRLTLMSDTKLYFEFLVNRRPRKLFLTSTHKLNNGEWQQVYIEYDSTNLRLTANDDSILIDFDPNDHLGTFEGPLFIGGAPSKYLIGDLSKRNGFTGCFRGLRIDNRPIDLNSYLSPSMPTVISGCQPSCTENLCQNGGKCVEYWGSYECQCSNPIAHSGNNCEINLNTNSITFVTQESYYAQHANESLVYPAYLVKNILLNVRTYQETALIFYASDRFNNFIQLHKNGSSMVLSFNSNATILTARLPIDDSTIIDLQPSSPVPPQNPPVALKSSQSDAPIPSTNLTIQLNMNTSTINTTSIVGQQAKVLTTTTTTVAPRMNTPESSIKMSNTSGSGQPIQIKIERHRLRTTFYVNNNYISVEKPMIFLNNITQQVSWNNPEQELVRAVKPGHKIAGKLQPRIFLAGLDDGFGTRLPGFTGCIQGFSVDNQLFDFNRAHLIGEFRGDYRIGCKMHCDSIPCKNQGVCIENWREDRIECKCDATSYIGRLCDEDIAALFNGLSSYFIYHIHNVSNKEKSSISQFTNVSEYYATIGVKDNNVGVDVHEISGNSNQTAANFIEISLAFSSEGNHSVSLEPESSSVQVLVFIAQANSSKHFLLGLTSDGGLLIQEDYGNSMALSRLIKRQDQPYNDGHRHMFRYTRLNQTIQIIVDHQTFLPTMSVIATLRPDDVAKKSFILVGTARDNLNHNQSNTNFLPDKSYSNYIGCISNLRIKLDSRLIEPLSEAFGQNLVTVNATRKKDVDNVNASSKSDDITLSPKIDVDSATKDVQVEDLPEDFALSSSIKADETLLGSKMLSIVDKSGHFEVLDKMDTIVARDVEQGKCASFKKVEINNGKRSINEPKYTPLLEPRPVYMDPPRIKTYKQPTKDHLRSPLQKDIGLFFYCSVTFVVIVSGSCLMYAYILQIRYKSERFRCDTPFFHNRRDEESNSPTLTE